MPEAMPYGETFYRFRNADDKGDAELELFDVIGFGFFGGKSAKQFRKELKEVLNATPKPKRLIIRVNSPGGQAFDGFAMANAIREVDIPTVSIVEGWAASAASTVAIAADTVRMHKTSMMMIHNPWSFAFGESKDMRKEADILDKIRDVIAEDYERKSGQDMKKILAAMDAETWFKASEAEEFGLADEVIDSEKKNAVLAWDIDTLPFQNLKPEYYTVGESSGVFNGTLPAQMFSTARRTRDAVFSEAAGTRKEFFDIYAAPRRVPGSVLERAEAATVAQGAPAAVGKPTQGDATMSTGDTQGAVPAVPASPAPASAAVAAAASAEASKSAADAALSEDRKRVEAILAMATPRTMATARELIANGTALADAVMKLTAAQSALPAAATSGGGGARNEFEDYGGNPSPEAYAVTDADLEVESADAPAPLNEHHGKFNRLVAAYSAKHSVSRGKAIEAMVKKHPELHAKAYSYNPKMTRA